MPIIRTRDDIHIDVPEGMALDAPEVREAIAAERQGRLQRKMQSPEFKAKVEVQRAQDREMYDPTKDSSAFAKVKENLGAGFDTTLQGIKQIVPGLKGPSDEDILEKRQRDAHLAEKTDLGVGADWMPTAGSALQFTGEAAPSLAIPGGALGRVGGKLFPRALAVTKANPMAAQLLGGAASGAAAGAMQPVTSDESRALNMVGGGVLGGALPLAMKAGRAVLGNITAARRAGGQLFEGLGDAAGGIEQQVAAREADRAARSAASQAIPESLAEATRSPRAAVVEARAGRGETNPEWADFKRAQNEARYAAVQDATQEAGAIDQRAAARATATDPMREGALKQARKDQWFHVPAAQEAQSILASDEGANPAVKTVMNYVMGEIEGGITPGRLYTVRKVLTDKLDGPAGIGDELGAAAKGAKIQTLKMIDAIDESLNQASGGKWNKYMQSFRRRSPGVDAAKAAQLVRDQFEREGTPLLGDVPEVTASRLGAAMRASQGEGSRAFPLTLSKKAQGTLSDVSENIARANEVQKARKLAGTAGGGAQTSSDIAQDIAMGGAERAIPGLGIARRIVAGRADRTQRELTALLQNPRAAVDAIKQAQALRQPLSEAQTLLIQSIAKGGGTALPLATQQQRY